jgi:hypothetical protein
VVIALLHKSLPVQVLGENLRIFVHAAILNDRGRIIEQLTVSAQAPGQKENLGVKRPGMHILIKISQIRIFFFRLIERMPVQTFAQHRYQG